jgi:hypothetical protein
MASLGRLRNSLVTAINENNAALVSLNLDFSLVKLDAPAVFAPVGSALTKRRRDNAEEGESHQVARRLGALFEQLIPSTPKLITAYGVRASEIVQTPGVNPKGTKADGPFESFVGVDGTSIWAAATSGPASLGVLLLAYMLARKFDDAKTSTAIWVELVADRQIEIEAAIKNNEVVSASSMIAARQVITREQLASFDASARAWLSSADQAKMSEQKRFMLILKNLEIPVNDGRSTYQKVVNAWKDAMTGLENLLCGMPHEISDGAILLALSAWHLYPDLVVLSNETKAVSFKDKLFPTGGVVTVGLRSQSTEESIGMQWSLALSHLRYYGDPVVIESAEDNSRVTMDQLRLVALGALFACWGIQQKDLLKAAQWLESLGQLVKRRSLLSPGSPTVIASRIGWLRCLTGAASNFVQSQGEERETYLMLINFGRRRRTKILGERTQWSQPFFGLCNPHITTALEANFNIEEGIRYMRNIAIESGLRASDALIMYWDETTSQCAQYATAVPHERYSLKRSRDDDRITNLVHGRWLDISDAPAENISMEKGKKSPDDFTHLRPANRNSQPESEEIYYANVSSLAKSNELRNLPTLFSPYHTCNSILTRTPTTQPGSCYCLNHVKQSYMTPGFLFSVAVGNCRRLALLVRLSGTAEVGVERETVSGKTEQVKTLAMRNQEECTDIAENKEWLLASVDYHDRILDYLDFVVRHPGRDVDRTFPQRHGNYSIMDAMQIVRAPGMPRRYLASLQALAIACSIYEPFSAVTVPLKMSSVPLHTARWFPSWGAGTPSLSDLSMVHLSRAETFSCVAMFESGGVNLRGDDLGRAMALSSGNSLFVAAQLVSDPSDEVPGRVIKRIVGNIGSPGISLLVPPGSVRMKSASENYDYRVVAHQNYDSKREDNFTGTTLHLKLTGWKIPFATGVHGLIDQDVFLREAVVSVRDKGKWIADLDVQSDLRGSFQMCTICCRCPKPRQGPRLIHTSVDSWDEVLEPPENIGIIRAKDNFAARLAAACILKRMVPQPRVGLLEGNIDCWRCMENHWEEEKYDLVID